MGATKIEWADEVWNPVTGCTPVSAGCENCYARRVANRLRGRFGYPADDPFRVTVHPDRLEEPTRWRKPRRIFVCSMGDLFHEDVPPGAVASVVAVMMKCKRHTFIVLTKRPERMRAAMESWPLLDPLPNVWFGVSVENQPAADERIPHLLKIPASVHMVSVEPMLGAVDLERVLWPGLSNHRVDVLRGGYWNKAGIRWGGASADLGEPKGGFTNHSDIPGRASWVICGGETGPGARPMSLEWSRSLRDQCQAAGVPFFFKSHGDARGWKQESCGRWVRWPVHPKSERRLLDGREWNEFPEVK